MAELKIKVTGDNKSLDNSMKKSEGLLTRFGNKAKSISAASIAAFATGVAAGFTAVAAGITAMVRAMIPVAREVDNIGKAAKRVGISSEEFQKLDFAIKRSGGSSADAEKIIKRMQKTITDAGRGSSLAVDALGALALTIDDLRGKSPESQFRIIAERMRLIKDETTKAALAQDIFGKKGTVVNVMIKDYESLRREVELMNGVIGEDGVRAAEEFTDALENLNTQQRAFLANVGAIEKMARALENLNLVLSGLQDKGQVLDAIAEAAASFTTTGQAGAAGTFFGEILKGQVLKQKVLPQFIDAFKIKPGDNADLVNKAAEAFTRQGGTRTRALLSNPQLLSDRFRAQGSNIVGFGPGGLSVEDRQLAVLENIYQGILALADSSNMNGKMNTLAEWEGEMNRIFQQ